MESVKRGTEELVCKKKTNGTIVWKWFGYKLSDDLQNQVFCLIPNLGLSLQSARQVKEHSNAGGQEMKAQWRHRYRMTSWSAATAILLRRQQMATFYLKISRYEVLVHNAQP